MFDQQKPIESGYGANTTADEVIRGIHLDGKVAIVTGGSSGLGLETVKALAKAGASVVVPARSMESAEEALKGIPRVIVAPLDLLDPGSVHAFAQSFLERHKHLDILINNAGIMATPLRRDARGYESQFSANHLGHFLLTTLLWPALERSMSARIVSLSSRGHQFSDFDFDDWNYERRHYDKWKAYGQSKTANILFAVEADRRGITSGIRAFAVHPGRVMTTNLTRYMDPQEVSAQRATYKDADATTLGIKSIAEGAATSVWCATSPALNDRGGVYCEDVDVAIVAVADGYGTPGVRPYAIDSVAAERLWALSESLT